MKMPTPKREVSVNRSQDEIQISNQIKNLEKQHQGLADMQTLSDQTAISKIRSPEELKEAKDKTENISTLKDLSNVQLAS